MSTHSPELDWKERLHYRDLLRNARYAALADAEGFGEVCFALEALGLRLRGAQSTMGKYVDQIRPVSSAAPTLTDLAVQFPALFTCFDALYETVNYARNDAMHTGVYARHATTAAIELCIGLEEAVMKRRGPRRTSVADFMVKAPVSVEPWQPVAHARQLMLTHSFSFLPILLGEWKLVSEIAMAQFLRGAADGKKSLATSIESAEKQGLDLIPATTVKAADEVAEVLKSSSAKSGPTLWLVTDESNRLCGVLSPFELM